MRGLGTDIGDSVEAEPLDTIIAEEAQELVAVPDEGAPRNLLVPNPEPPPWYFVLFSFIEEAHKSPLDVIEHAAHILIRVQAPRLWLRASPHHVMERRREDWDRLLPLSQADGLAEVLEELTSGVRAAVAI